MSSNAFKRGMLKIMLMLSLNSAAERLASAGETVSSGDAQTELPAADTETTKLVNYDKVKINTLADLEKLFNRSLPIIFPELVLEEVPMQRAYDDYGKYKGAKNTVGVGSMHSPVNINDYKKSDVVWYAVRRNPKTLQSKTYSYSDMAKLAIGWGYRTKVQPVLKGSVKTSTSVLSRMFTQLKGAELRPNEFAALYCACYNNENNISRLCSFVAKNYASPLSCANEIMFWDGGAASNGGTRDRCLFEALVYMNVDGFCESMLNMRVCPGSRASCICLKLERKRYSTLKSFTELSNKYKKKYLGVVYKNGLLVQTTMNGLDGLLNGHLVFSVNEESDKLQKDYDAAIRVYNSGDYGTALTKFLDLQTRGADGCDILNDIAITYYKLKNYNKCIEYCQKVLRIGDHMEYAKAVYNAGLAYEKLGNKEQALKNFEKAEEYLSRYGIADQDASIDYLSVYQNAQARVR